MILLMCHNIQTDNVSHNSLKRDEKCSTKPVRWHAGKHHYCMALNKETYSSRPAVLLLSWMMLCWKTREQKMLSFLSKPGQDNSPALSTAQSVWHVNFKASWRDAGRLFCALSWWHCIVAGEGHVRRDKAWTMCAVFVNRSTLKPEKGRARLI